jgi:hypothetical protein
MAMNRMSIFPPLHWFSETENYRDPDIVLLSESGQKQSALHQVFNPLLVLKYFILPRHLNFQLNLASVYARVVANFRAHPCTILLNKKITRVKPLVIFNN